MTESNDFLDSVLKYLDFRIENLVHVRRQIAEISNNESQIIDVNDINTFAYRLYFAFDNLANAVDVLRSLDIGLPTNHGNLKQKVITPAELTKIIDEVGIEDKVLQYNVRYFYNKKRGCILNWNLKDSE